MEIGKTMSVCPVCLAKIPAKKAVGEDGNIYMEKRCWEHGSFRTLIWEGDLESEKDGEYRFEVILGVVNSPILELPETGSNAMALMPIGLALCAAVCMGAMIMLKKKEV